MNKRKLLRKILSGSKNIRFADMLTLAQAFGFRLDRIEGSHHIMVHPDVPRPLNLQKVGGQAKPYQVRQFLKLIEQHNLRMED
jgi:predicted RNA binding protein YcfA (HicA-like mRNA interferase family)